MSHDVRIIHTVASTRLDHGGTSRSVPALCDALAHAGADVHLVAGRPADQHVACGWPVDATRVHTVGEAARWRSWGMGGRFRRQLAELCDGESAPIIHDHGVWLATNHATAVFARRRGVIRIVSPRGMLTSWSMRRSWLKKRAAWYAYQQADLATATAFHATAAEEAAEIRALGFTQPIVVIPNGIALPPAIDRTTAVDGRRTMLFLSRIHPKKGLLNLVRAWAAAAPGPEWRLMIAGPDEDGHRSDVERVVAEQGISTQVSFLGEIADADKWRWYAAADVFVLPSFSENFGNVVAESLFAETPVITTTGAPWAGLLEHRCGWWVEPTVDGVAAALRSACSLPPQALREMGQRGRAWAMPTFAWPGIAARMVAAYEALLNGSTTPDTIAGS